MLAQQILDDVRRELLEFGAEGFWSDAELLRSLNRGQLDYVNRTRLLEDSATVDLTQGRIDYPLPANWLSARLVLLRITNSDGSYRWKRLSGSTLEKSAQENIEFLDNSTNKQGEPSSYYIWGTTLYIRRAPDDDSSGTLYLFYRSKPETITDPSTQHIQIDESLSESLNAYILWKAWAKEKEADLAIEQKATYLEYVAEGRRWAKKKYEKAIFDIQSSTPFSTISGLWPL